MDGAKAKIAKLLGEGERFTYENFSTKSQHGYPDAYSPEWVAWRARVSGAVTALFGDQSAPAKMLHQGERVSVLRNEADHYELAKSYYMGALRAALEVLDEDTFGEIKGGETKGPLNYSNRVFVVHGRDESAKQQLEIFLAEIGLEPVVLHRETDGGRTLIEKFEHYADVGYAFILLTPDEIAYVSNEDGNSDDERLKERRARPNVIFEFGYFVGKLGRHRTCCLLKEPVVVPSDLNGLVYKSFNGSVEEIGYAIIKELRAAGYKLSVT